MAEDPAILEAVGPLGRLAAFKRAINRSSPTEGSAVVLYQDLVNTTINTKFIMVLTMWPYGYLDSYTERHSI